MESVRILSELGADPSGAVHALAAKVSQGVSGLGAGVSTSVVNGVAKISSWLGPSPPRPRANMPYDDLADDPKQRQQQTTQPGVEPGVGASPGAPGALPSGELAARSAARRAAHEHHPDQQRFDEPEGDRETDGQ